MIVAMCLTATYFVLENFPGAFLWLMIPYAAALILFARLLGRLAWRLAEAMPLKDDLD